MYVERFEHFSRENKSPRYAVWLPDKVLKCREGGNYNNRLVHYTDLSVLKYTAECFLISAEFKKYFFYNFVKHRRLLQIHLTTLILNIYNLYTPVSLQLAWQERSPDFLNETHDHVWETRG